MRHRITVLVIGFIIATTATNAQQDRKSINVGVGIGLHYGGIGINIAAAPVKFVALEVGLGYNLVGVGINGGLAFRILPDKRICPDIGFLYGYNAAIKVKNAPDSSQSYYGFSAAAGVKIWNKVHRHYFNLQLVLPFRSDEYEADLNRFVVETKPPDFAISLGYHF